ncbi:MAG TPA: alpha/beta fold hydrolase [Ilumatobacteraceae bacterium]|nr:alpha/beta fold hydrolase [Ilumatobacteraceae bacterium]
MSASLPIVLVHGAWHGAWCWAGLQHALDDLGVPSYAIDLPGHGASTAPLTDLYGDAEHVADVLRTLGTPVVLVGHSYGGAVITEAAGRHPEVAHLVYLTAFALEAGESVMSLLTSLPRADIALGRAIVPRDDGTSVVDATKAATAFYAECSPAAVSAALARLSPQPMITFADAVTGSPRDHIASTYVRCLRDQAIHISHQDAMAQRCNTVHTLDTDHSPFVSRIAETAAILQGIAAS